MSSSLPYEDYANLQQRLAELEQALEEERAYRKRTECRAAELNAIIQSIPEAVLVGTEEGITIANDPALRMIGVQSTDELRQDIATLVEKVKKRDADTGEAMSAEQTSFAYALNGELNESDVIIRHMETGEERVLRSSSAPVMLNGEIISAVSMHMDITDQRTRENQQRFLADIMAEMNDVSLSLEARIQRLVHLLVPRIADLCVFHELGETDHLEVLALAHRDAAHEAVTYDHLQRYPIELEGVQPVAQALRTGQTIHYTQVTDAVKQQMAINDEQLAELRAGSLSSLICMPLIAHGRAIGVLSFLTGKSGRSYTQQDVVFIEELAWRVALALDNARLFERQQRARQEAEWVADRAARLQRTTAALVEHRTLDEVMRIVIEQAVLATGAYGSVVMQLSEDGTILEIIQAYEGYDTVVLQHWGTFPLDVDVPATTVLHTNAPIWIESPAMMDEHYPHFRHRDSKSKAWAALPLQQDEQAIGVIGLSFATEHPFSAEERAFLLTLAQQCSQALQRARLYAAEQRARQAAELAADRAARLYTVSRALSEALTPAQVVEVILDHGVAALDARSGIVLQCSRDGTRLETIGERGYPPTVFERWESIPVDAQVPVAEVIRTRAPVWVESAEERTERFPEVANDPAFAEEGSWANLPLWIEERMIGVLGLNFDTFRVFPQEERGFMLALAWQCTQALERARLYEAEQKARAIAEAAVLQRDQVFSLISHDLKTPLASIQGYIQILQHRLLQSGLSDTERLERGLNNIAVTATRVASQVEELMDIASLQAGQVLKLNQTPRDLLPLVQRVVESCQQLSTWHTITLTTTEEHLRCHVDELRLERVFGNLLTNAIKYSPQGGDVQVRVVQETHEGQTWAVLSITDHGVGIPGEDLPTIFDAFRRGSNVSNSIAGTGLGLASARQIIEQHGGTIAVQSEVEAGSTFTIWLPSLDT